MEACRKKFLDGRFDLVHCLLQNGANINCSSAHVRYLGCCYNSMWTFLRMGGHLCTLQSWILMCCPVIIWCNFCSVVRLIQIYQIMYGNLYWLLNCHLTPLYLTQSGKTPLHYAVENGRIQVAQTILESSWTVVDRLDKVRLSAGFDFSPLTTSQIEWSITFKLCM